jgi:hypothetical protein
MIHAGHNSARRPAWGKKTYHTAPPRPAHSDSPHRLSLRACETETPADSAKKHLRNVVLPLPVGNFVSPLWFVLCREENSTTPIQRWQYSSLQHPVLLNNPRLIPHPVRFFSNTSPITDGSIPVQKRPYPVITRYLPPPQTRFPQCWMEKEKAD